MMARRFYYCSLAVKLGCSRVFALPACYSERIDILQDAINKYNQSINQSIFISGTEPIEQLKNY